MPEDIPQTAKARRSVIVEGFTNSVLDPGEPMLGPVEDGGTIIANTAPGCWGPMITPSLRGGHEVTRPVYVEGAEPGGRGGDPHPRRDGDLGRDGERA